MFTRKLLSHRMHSHSFTFNTIVFLLTTSATTQNHKIIQIFTQKKKQIPKNVFIIPGLGDRRTITHMMVPSITISKKKNLIVMKMNLMKANRIRGVKIVLRLKKALQLLREVPL